MDGYELEFRQLQKFELLALRKKAVGKKYHYNLTGKEGCNSTTIQYLGVVKTKKGKHYKVLNSFFVYTASSTCMGTSKVKIYDMKNRYVGCYDVGMPDDLPIKIIQNKLIYWENSDNCKARNGFSINIEKGLPKRFAIPCTQNGGDEFVFSND